MPYVPATSSYVIDSTKPSKYATFKAQNNINNNNKDPQ